MRAPSVRPAPQIHRSLPHPRFPAPALGLAALLAAGLAAATPDAAPPPLRLAVMDPLAADLSCPCVEGHAQRDYRALASRLEDQLARPLHLVFAESIGKARTSLGAAPDLVIGKHSVVAHDLDREHLDGQIGRASCRERV